MLSPYRLGLLVSLFGLVASSNAQSQPTSKSPQKSPVKVQALPSKMQHLAQLNKAFFEASKAGNTARMEELLKLGADVNSKDKRQGSPLFVAIKGKSMPALRLLMKRGANLNQEVNSWELKYDEINERYQICQSVYEITALDYALYLNQVGMARLLLEAGAKSPDREGVPVSFQMAINLKSSSLLQELLSRQPAKARASVASRTLLLVADVGQAESIKLLVAAGADAASCTKALSRTCAANDLDNTLLLLKSGADPNVKDESGYSPLTAIVARDWSFLDWPEPQTNSLDPRHFSPEYIKGVKVAAEARLLQRRKAEEMFGVLLAHGADPDQVSGRGFTPLLLALDKGDLVFVKALLEAGAKPNFSPRPFPSPLRLLAYAVGDSQNGDSSASEFSFQTNSQMEPQMREWYQFLLDAPKRLDIKQVEMAQLLIDKGADPKEGDNRFALGEALINRKGALAKLLLDNGADPNFTFTSLPYFQTPRFRIAQQHTAKEAEAEERQVNERYSQQPKRQFLPLHLAVSTGEIETVKMLLAAKADINATDSQGNNALHYLARGGKYGAFRHWEQEVGVSLDEKTGLAAASSPQQISAHANQTAQADREITLVLIAAGCNGDTPNSAGKTPLQIALAKSDLSVIDVLLRSGAKQGLETSIFEVIQNGRHQSHVTPALEALQNKLAECDRIDLWWEKREPSDAFTRTREKQSTEQAKQGRTLAFNKRTQLLKLWGQRDAAIVTRLIQNGADLEVRNSQGLTPLMLAARLGQKEVVMALLKAGVKSNATNRTGETIEVQVKRYGQANIKSLPVKEKPQKGEMAESWYAPKVIQARETRIRQMLKREDVEIIQLLTRK